MSLSHSDEECFIPAVGESNVCTPTDHDQQSFDVNIKYLLPEANQLRLYKRPNNYQARTCFLEMAMRKIPEVLNEACVENQVSTNSCSGCVINKSNMQTLPSQYFSCQEFKQIYNKMLKYNFIRFPGNQLTSRFHNISQLEEYNEKMLQELYQPNCYHSSFRCDDDTFDSSFESGNLGLVYTKINQSLRQYYLLLENDTNTHGYNSWFFFKVESCGAGTAKFHLTNMVKFPSMFHKGMKISVFSVSKFQESGQKWFKGGENIAIYQTNLLKQTRQGSFYSCLYFQYTFQEGEKEVYFAMSQPYTFTRMISFLSNNFQTHNSFDLQANNSVDFLTNNEVKLQHSGSTINLQIDSSVNSENQGSMEQAGPLADVFEIPSQNQLQCEIKNEIYSISSNAIPVIRMWKGSKQLLKRKAIVFMARQHPAEVIGSFIMEQVLKLFKSGSKYSQDLLREYFILVIPMVNPDGVICGNSRCNLAGLDLNRQWMKSQLPHLKGATPQTNSLRRYLWQVNEAQGIQFTVDLHGHSKKLNSFMFCNKVNGGSNKPPWYLPYIFSVLEPRFELSSCTFDTTPDKKNTLRNQMFEDGMRNCITFENSYTGYNKNGCPKLYNESDYRKLAENLIKVLHFVLLDGEDRMENYLQGSTQKQLLSNLAEINKREKLQIIFKNVNEQKDIESDSDPEEGIMNNEEMKKIMSSQEKTKLRFYMPVESKKLRPQRQRQSSRKSDLKVEKESKPVQENIRMSEPVPQTKIKATAQNYKSEKRLRILNSTPKSTILRRTYQPKRSQNHPKTGQKKIPSRSLQIDSSEPEQERSRHKNQKVISIFTHYPPKTGPSHNPRRIIENSPMKMQIARRYKTETTAALEQAISQIKVQCMGMIPKSELNSSKHQASGKGKNSKTRMKTESAIRQTDILNSNRVCSRNYRNQILRRKKIYHWQKSKDCKFKRFQNFVQKQPTMLSKKGHRVRQNSVFYHFPIL